MTSLSVTPSSMVTRCPWKMKIQALSCCSNTPLSSSLGCMY